MSTDLLHRYIFEDVAIRGECVQINNTFQQMIAQHNYPSSVSNLLGELAVATALLTATLKFKGKITLQIQGDGPVSLLVVNGDDAQNLRGVARWQNVEDTQTTLAQLVGQGQLVITITPDKGERYQGIVALDGKDIAECLEHYFERSEQLTTRLWLRCAHQDGQACAGGLLLQNLPSAVAIDQENAFHHLAQLTNTIKNEELFLLPAQEILNRLYHQENVRVFEGQAVQFVCGCSRQQTINAITSLGEDEINHILEEDGIITTQCEFCGNQFQFTAKDFTA